MRWSILKTQIVFADGREQLPSPVVWGSFPIGTGVGLAQSRQTPPPSLDCGWICVQIYPMELKDHAWTFLPSSYTTLLHQKWGFHIYVCLSLCRNSSSSVVTFSMPLCKPKMKFFVFTFATSCLFSVLSLFSAEETAMLMLETEDLCFQNIQDWQSASNGELVCCCFFCGCRPCGHIPATLHLCGVSKRTGPHAVWSFQES